LWGGFFKDRYTGVIQEAVVVEGASFRRVLVDAAGTKWGGRLWQLAADGQPEASARSVAQLRRAVWWRAWLRAPVSTIRRYLAFVFGELRLRLVPHVPWIRIAGTSGSATSALVDKLCDRFGANAYGNVIAFHWRPRSPIRASATKLAIDWLVTYWKTIVRLRAKGYILVLDGTYFDLVKESLGGSRRMARAFSRILPAPDLAFFLDSASGTVASGGRSASASADQLPSDSGLSNFQRLDGTRSVDLLANEILTATRAWMSQRTAAALGMAPPSAIPGAVANAERSSILVGRDGAR
jgi:hypothetical protein